MRINIIDESIEKEYNELAKKESLLPIKIPQFYLDKVIDEVNAIGIGGPLYNSVIPTKDKIAVKSSFETRDYVEEKKHLPIPQEDYIIQKYLDRVVFLISDICFGHCQYCFRSYNLSIVQQSSQKEKIRMKVHMLKEYLHSNSRVKEVILSGGDPLCIGYENLEYVMKELSDWNIRIHTRAIIYDPDIFNKDIISLLKKYNVRLVFHINHPYEICESVEKVIRIISNNGIRIYSQFPLLRGINDNSAVIIDLLAKMDELNIRPLSIFIPDPITYGAAYRIRYKRIIKIMDEVNWNTPSWINSVRFVLDTTIGKVRRENIVDWTGNRITFSRNGQEVYYYDLDDGIDIPTDIHKLLWKDDLNKNII